MTKISHYIAGMQNVERDIMSAVRKKGLPISQQDFKWNGGVPLGLAPPGPTQLEVRVGSKKAAIDFTLKELEDCSQFVESLDARAKVALIVTTLAQK